MKNDRLFQIIYILLEKKSVTAPELASMLQVSSRTIYRDIDTLSFCGVPVYTVSGKNGGISILPGFTFDKALLSDEEQDQILFALQSINTVGQNVKFLLSKLGSVFKKENRNWIEVDFSPWGREMDAVRFDIVKQAILERKILQIHYVGSSSEKTKRYIKPIKLIFKSKNWYVQAYCLQAQDFRIFKVTRIFWLALTEERFNDEFEEIPPIEFKNASLNCTELKLRFSPQSLFRIHDEFQMDQIDKQIDGSVIVTVSVPIDRWLYSYLLSFGSEVEILEPLSIKKELLKYIEEMKDHYKS